MRLGSMLVAAVLTAYLVVPAPAQFGDLVGDYLDLSGDLRWNGVEIDAVNTGAATDRRWLRGDGTWSAAGLADVGRTERGAALSTMSSAWQTVMGVTVDVPGAADRVLITVSGQQIAWMGLSVLVLDDTGDELCEIPDPTAPAVGVTCRELAAVITSPQGMTTRPAGGVYVVDTAGDELCEIPDPTAPAVGVTCRGQAAIEDPRGITTRPAGGVYVVGGAGGELCEIPDPTAPAVGVTCRELAAEIGNPQGMTTRPAGGVYVVDAAGGELCEIPDPTAPAVGVTCRELAAEIGNPGGMTTRPAGGVYVVDAGDELCEIPDPTAPAVGVVCRGMAPAGITTPQGVVSVGDSACQIRLARGATAIETTTLAIGRVLLDTTYIDMPGAGGLTTYALQVRTGIPSTLCIAMAADAAGTRPRPSMLVQAFYGP